MLSCKNGKLCIKFGTVLIVYLLVLVSFSGLFLIENDNVKANTLYVGGSGAGNHTTIQSAIDNASSGDTVFVYSGKYNEDLVINKTIKLIGQDMNTTIIHGTGNSSGTTGNGNRTDYYYGSGNGSVIYVNASGVVISGFTIRNGSSGYWSAGIELWDVKDCTIINNNISSNNNTGIFVYQSINISIRNNYISSNKWYGIYFYLSLNNSVVNNVLIKNNIEIYASKHNSIKNNEITGPSEAEGVNGININYVSENTEVVSNNIRNWIGSGIRIHYSNNNNISNNIIDDNGHSNLSQHGEFSGIDIFYAQKNTISGNLITKSGYCGIGASRSGNNQITFNKIYDNPTGISCSSNEVWNAIYLNEFINNTKNAGEISSYNVWNSTKPLSYVYKGENYTKYLGNYWDDYTGKDSDSDGIGDTPYDINNLSKNKDYFPLVDSIVNYTLIPSTTKMKLIEVCSNSTNLTVSLQIKMATLNASITGVLNGTVNVTKMHLFIITSGSFAGFGFFKSVWRAIIEGKVYEGTWQGMLFNKTGERKFYLKGTVFGGLRGITDGYLIESTSGSGVYNLYNSTWTLNHLGSELIFAELNVNGTMDYQTSKKDTSEIYILQGIFKGNATGYYNKSIGVVLTQVRMNNKTKEYYGLGFSIISYDCAYGSGTGWTYDNTYCQNITKMTGSFTEPLLGLIFGKLDETGPKRILYITIERIDIGLPPRAILIVNVWGPWRVSPGQTIHYFLEYKNIGLKTAINTEIVLMLPNNTTHITNTEGGSYNSTAHEVTWRRNISAKSREIVNVKCKVKWGLPWGTKLLCKGYIRDFIQNKILATDSFVTRVTPAVDPNMKYGPEGNVTQGQKLNYKIEFENIGAGIAFGVYFTDELNKNLDDSTLEIGPVRSASDDSIIAPPGIYNPSTRVITWFVGEVGPGAGGYANLNINVRDDATAGTEIINYGTVYFPSVPEITRTNGIVSVVRDNQGPTAIVSGKKVVNTYEYIIFNGSGSFDPDGEITTYIWNFGDGTLGYGKTVSHYYVDDGEYSVTLTVKDDMDVSDSKKISIQVLNRPPVAKLEVDSKDVKNLKLIFNASKSTDVDGVVSEYNFDFGDGSNSGWIQTPIISHKYADSTKTFTVKLEVRDDDGEISKNIAELNIVVNNKPIPKLTVNLMEAYTYSDIVCSGESSTDSDGQVSSYYFDFGDGTNSGWVTTASISHQYTDGTKKYSISLKVKDNDGALSDEISIAEILIKNRKPVPSLIVENLEVYVLEEVRFDASGSYDLDGEELEYYFNFGDSTDSGWVTNPVIKHIYTKGPLDYSVELSVKDSDGEIDTMVVSITVNNRVPHADAGADRTIEINQAVDFDGSESYDPDGNLLTYKWSFGDGTTTDWLNSAKTTHSYTQAGDYTVTLSVSDGTLTATDTCLVQVKDVEAKKDTDSDSVPDESDAFPNDAAASVDSDGDHYPDYWNFGKSEDDSTTGLKLDDYPNDPDRHEKDKSTDAPSENIYLMGIIIIFIVILIIGILTSIIRNNKNKRIKKPFDSNELIRNVRDEIIEGEVSPEPELSDDTLWTNLKMKYKNGQISEETYRLLEQEKLTHDSETHD